eukprot:CAMPEP_0177645274 /NCGR_PEP_ID=MMETSP0447-20121125/9162_1 /TAXON_ID=0 /ORGANISM="Stygamoeba regulata, Strain BSH-02190019" /LENGTH=907 /DNA_ID=CAMNT_0019147747 /DNA_START=174 /DNA_END=2898 /DNA_ORIENTATION=+
MLPRHVHAHEALMQRMSVASELSAHRGCVNRLCWNRSGSLLASVSDDLHLCLWSYPPLSTDSTESPTTPTSSRSSPSLSSSSPASSTSLWSSPPIAALRLRMRTGHQNNIFGVAFLPHHADHYVVTGAMDSAIIIHNVDIGKSCVIRAHSDRVKEIEVDPSDPHTFWSAGEDGTVRQVDVRTRDVSSLSSSSSSSSFLSSTTTNILIRTHGGEMGHEFKSLSLNPISPMHLAVASNDPFVRLYDRRMLSVGDSSASASRRGCFARLCPSHLVTHSRARSGSGSGSGRSGSGRSGSGRSRSRSTFRGLPTEAIYPTSVAFSPVGDSLLVNYSCDQIYSFSTAFTSSSSSSASGSSAASSSCGRWSSIFAQDANETDEAEAYRYRSLLSGEALPPDSDYDPPPVDHDVAMSDAPTPSGSASRSPLTSTSSSSATAATLSPWPTATRACCQRRLEESVCDDPRRQAAAAIFATLDDHQRQTSVMQQDDRSDDDDHAAAAAAAAAQHPDATRVGVEALAVLSDLYPCHSASSVSSSDSTSSSATTSSSTTSPSAVPLSSGLHTDRARALLLRGWRGDVSEARREASLALQLCPHNAEALIHLARALYRLELCSRSVLCLRRALSLLKRDPPHLHPYAALVVQLASDLSDQMPSDCEYEGDDQEQRGEPEGGEPEEDEGALASSPVGSGTSTASSSTDTRRSGSGSGQSPVESAHSRWFSTTSSSSSSTTTTTTSCSPPLYTNYEQRYVGRANAQTDIKEANHVGERGEVVAAGSDCGSVFLWDRRSGRLLNVLHADQHVVNAVRANPFDATLASSGIENVVRLWQPLSAVPSAESHRTSASSSSSSVSYGPVNAEEWSELVAENQTLMSSEAAMGSVAVSPEMIQRLLAHLSRAHDSLDAGDEESAECLLQ